MFEGNPGDPRDFHNPEWSAIRIAGCDKLAEYMQENGISTKWWEAVKSNQQDPWAKLKINDVNKQMMQFNHVPGTTIRI
jgi:hypothetical protein